MASVGSVYAKALFELGQESGKTDSILKELKSFAETLQSHSSLSLILSGSAVNPNVQKAVLGDLMGLMQVSPVVQRFLELFLERGRLSEIALVVDRLEALIDKSQGVQMGQVRSAVELSQDEISVLGSAIAKRVGGKVKLSQVVDPSLLGGVVATVSGRTFDASLRSQLERFKNELI